MTEGENMVERKRRWKMDAIAETVRQNVAAATDGWSAEQLRAKLTEVLTQVEPIRYTLSHIADNPDGPHSGMTVSSHLFPEQFDEDYQGPDPWTSAWDKDLKKSVPVAFAWDGEPPERAHWQSAEFPGGVTPGPSFNILEVWHYATAASIFCGSFGTDDVLALNAACSLRTALSQPNEEVSWPSNNRWLMNDPRCRLRIMVANRPRRHSAAWWREYQQARTLLNLRSALADRHLSNQGEKE